MSALHFLRRRPERVVRVVHIHHNTGEFADDSEALVQAHCRSEKIELSTHQVADKPRPGESRENHWREQRFRFFEEEYAFHGLPIVLAHNLDDCFEEFISCTMLRGFLGTIPYRHGACIRPFRLWKRSQIEKYARRFKIPYIQDPSNYDYTRFTRAKIRSLVAPRIRNLNPGVYRIVEKVIREQDVRNDDEGEK
jgi:tRNA(Ile)-lysidine synthase